MVDTFGNYESYKKKENVKKDVESFDDQKLKIKQEKQNRRIEKKKEKKLNTVKSEFDEEQMIMYNDDIEKLDNKIQADFGIIQTKIERMEAKDLEKYEELLEKYGDKIEEYKAKINQLQQNNPKNIESLSKDESVQEIQLYVYELLGINLDTYQNGTVDKFMKGLIDSLLIGNAELAKQIYDTNGKVILDMIETIFSFEGLQSIAKGLGTSIGNLFSGDAYLTGKSIGELGLIVVGSGAIGWGVKKVGKTMIDQGFAKTGKIVKTTGEIIQYPYKGVKKIGGMAGRVIQKTGEITGVSEVLRKVKDGTEKMRGEGKGDIDIKDREKLTHIIDSIHGFDDLNMDLYKANDKLNMFARYMKVDLLDNSETIEKVLEINEQIVKYFSSSDKIKEIKLSINEKNYDLIIDNHEILINSLEKIIESKKLSSIQNTYLNDIKDRIYIFLNKIK